MSKVFYSACNSTCGCASCLEQFSLPLGAKTNCESLRGFKTDLKTFIMPGL